MTVQCLAQLMSKTVRIPCTVIGDTRSENDRYAKSFRGKKGRIFNSLKQFDLSEICDRIRWWFRKR